MPAMAFLGSDFYAYSIYRSRRFKGPPIKNRNPIHSLLRILIINPDGFNQHINSEALWLIFWRRLTVALLWLMLWNRYVAGENARALHGWGIREFGDVKTTSDHSKAIEMTR